MIADWSIDYNATKTPHALNGLTPTKFCSSPEKEYNQNRLD
jgi:hypothetical protein